MKTRLVTFSDGPNIQRCHRFPARLYHEIKAIADVNGVSFSRVVNALLLEGIESVNRAIEKQNEA